MMWNWDPTGISWKCVTMLRHGIGTSLVSLLGPTYRLVPVSTYFRTQKAERLGRLLDLYPTAPSFVPFPSSDTPAPAPLASTHCRLAACVTVWCNSPSVTSIGLISGGHKIVTFVTKAFGCDPRLNNHTRTQ